ncbi:MAG: 16S rRNA (cytosine(967)-C(5))-methyltransferase RsmB [Planctomycetota bacterium]|jgi:16S rRNA (cytosine967-C5)-methyltransferase
MARIKPSNARFVASGVLNLVDLKRTNAREILSEYLKKTSEKQRTTELVLGTIRNRNTIDMLIGKLAGCPIQRIPDKIKNVIRTGVYELLYCPSTPVYSIVNEAVENAKALTGKKQVGFVNAVLRQIERSIKERQVKLKDSLSLKTVPQTLETGCQFNTDIFSDPGKQPADYLSEAFSLPNWLIKTWIEDFGLKKAQEICFASNRRGSIYIRANSLKTNSEKLAEKLSKAHFEFQIIDEIMIKIKNPGPIKAVAGFSEGLFSVQDLTASRPAKLLCPKANEKILDLCAAPGTKTTQLAEISSDKAKIIATDIDGERLKKVKETIQRLGIKSIKVIEYNRLASFAEKSGGFDSILLDVPCSNTGVLSKRSEVRYRINKKAIKQLAKTQHQILQDAVKFLKPNGRICYSTCSIQKDENGELIKKFLKQNKEFEAEQEILTLPSAREPDCDGGYATILSNTT